MRRKYKELDGAWEEPGVVGTRIEISGRKLTVLWRSDPVLETTFSAEENDGMIVLSPKETDMRNRGDTRVYASVTGLSYSDGELTFTEMFPITGESRAILRKTENSRFGNYDVADDILKELQGTWKDKTGYFEFTVKKNVLDLNGHARKIHVLRPRSGGTLVIADDDPSVTEWDGFTRFEYYGDRVVTRMIVFDAPGAFPEYVFEKVR